MKYKLLLLLQLLWVMICSGQSYKSSWSERLSLKNNHGLLGIAYNDPSGLYLVQGKWRMTGYYMVGAEYEMERRIQKLDPSFGEVYTTYFEKQLKGVDYDNIHVMNGRIYLFVREYNSKQKEMSMYGLEIDKASGNLLTEKKLLFTLPVRAEASIKMLVQPLCDSTGWIVVCDLSDKEQLNYQVLTFSADFKPLETFRATPAIAPNVFNLTGIFVANKKMLLMGKEFELKEGKKKNKKLRVFKQVAIMKYGENGVSEGNIPFDTEGKLLLSGQAIQQKNGDVYMLGFFNDNTGAQKDKISGVYFARIDIASASVARRSFHSLTATELGLAPKPDEVNEEVALDNNLAIRAIFPGEPNGNLLIVGEHHQYEWDYQTGFSNNTYYIQDSREGNIMVINLNPNSGQIEKTYTVRKEQTERSSTRMPRMGLFAFSGLSRDDINFPFFTSFTAHRFNDQLLFFYNEPSESNSGGLFSAVNSGNNFSKGDFVVASLNLNTGDIKRKILFNNEGETIPMPRFGYVSGNDIFFPARKQVVMIGSPTKICKISIR